ncbi:MAG TPA: WYL domain-containing protein [Nitrospirota bacterium]|nr:WYL domain-containing protein [Nitrospirota bacterium]
MNRGSIRRIQKIDSMIRLGKMHSAEQLAEEFEVSRRTIERDIEMLRFELGAEVVYNRQKCCYEYKGKPLPLPGQWLNEREIAIMLIAERALRIYTGTSFSDEVHPVFNKLLNPIRDNKKAMEYIKDLCKSVYFYRPFGPMRDLRTEFSTVLNAIMERRRLSMKYQTAARGKAGDERRELEPYVLINNGGDWYVIGQCRQANEIRTFSLARVFEPKIEDHYFDIPDSFKVEDYLSKGFGRMHGDKPVQVRLAITPPASAWIAGSKWHSSQKIKQNSNGSIILTMTCPITDTLVRWVLQMGGNVKVETPKQLRELVNQAASDLVGNNPV